MLQNFVEACRRSLRLGGGSKFSWSWDMALPIARIDKSSVGNTTNLTCFDTGIQAHCERHSSSSK